jgi:hypothetical protein
MHKEDELKLKRRYLLWFYKTAKEEFDRIERKFTQLDIDRQLLKEFRAARRPDTIKKFVDVFEGYIEKKEKEGQELKFKGNELTAEYQFLTVKLAAIEKVIRRVLGEAALREIKSLYDDEMTARILRSTEH